LGPKVRERERGREGGREREREGEGGREREREGEGEYSMRGGNRMRGAGAEGLVPELRYVVPGDLGDDYSKLLGNLRRYKEVVVVM